MLDIVHRRPPHDFEGLNRSSILHSRSRFTTNKLWDSDNKIGFKVDIQFLGIWGLATKGQGQAGLTYDLEGGGNLWYK